MPTHAAIVKQDFCTIWALSAADESDEDDPNSRLAICGKTFERATQCAMAAMDRNPVEFASYLPYFLPLYSNNALLTMDAAAVHRIRPKRRILLMQFLARALLCPVYQTEWLDAHGAGECAYPQIKSTWSTSVPTRSRGWTLGLSASSTRLINRGLNLSQRCFSIASTTCPKQCMRSYLMCSRIQDLERTTMIATAKRRVLVKSWINTEGKFCIAEQITCADAGAALQMEEVNTARPKIIAADKALTDLHTEPQCTRLVESIVTKYLALTPAELEEWQVRAAVS